MKKNIYVLYGGKSVEHEVSLLTAFSVIKSLSKEKYNIYPVYITADGVWCSLGLLEKELSDINELRAISSNTVVKSMVEFLLKYFKEGEKNVIFPALHGTNGEDGTIQGLLEVLNVPYVGNGVLSSAVGIDKVIMKDLFAKADIPQVKYIPFLLHEWNNNAELVIKKIEDYINYPCFVKPASLGSSVGINRCGNADELRQGINEAFLYDNKIVVEEEVLGREMQISVIGNDYPESSVVGEFIQERNFMDYDAKYLDGKLIQVIPARLTPQTSEKMREVALDTFKVLNCSGLVRVDYFVTDDNKFYVNEVNTMPGFTSLSMTPVLWEKTDGTNYSQLVEKLIDLAIERHEQKENFIFSRRQG